MTKAKNISDLNSNVDLTNLSATNLTTVEQVQAVEFSTKPA